MGPPPPVLIGFDGSDGARDAIALAGDVAPGADAVVVYVPPHEDPLAHRYRLADAEGLSIPPDFFDEAIAALAGQPEVRTYVGASPAHVLCDLTEKEDFDLVVVGSPHRGVIGRALIGSVAEALLHGARAPVAVAPRGLSDGDHGQPRRIAVAYDTTPESEAAVRCADGLVSATGASLEVLTVVGRSPVASSPLVDGPTETPKPHPLVGLASLGIGKAGDAHSRMLIGPVADALADACTEDHIDLLILGSRDYGPLKRALASSLSLRLIRAAPCPVLLVPRP